MTQANSSATLATGDVIATHTIAGKEHQANVQVGPAGHIVGSLDTWLAWFPWSVAVAAARTTHLDVFNAVGSGKVVKLRGLWPSVDLATAVTGVGFKWELIRTNAVGTGGTVITPNKTQTAFAALPAGITLRQKPAGGATTLATYFGFSLFSEETNVSAQLVQYYNLLLEPPEVADIALAEGEGIKVDQVTNSAAGNFGWLLAFTIE